MIVQPAEVALVGTRWVDVLLFESALPLDEMEREEWRKTRCAVAPSLRHPDHKKKDCIPLAAETMHRVLDDLDLNVPVILNKPRSAFYHQAVNHYAEMQLVKYLVERCGFMPLELLYENWRLSASAAAFKSRAQGSHAIGAAHVRECLGNRFLSEISLLISANRARPVKDFFPTQHVGAEQRAASHNDHVDIFAFSNGQKRCGFFEVKQDDDISAHQPILLAFAAYVGAKRRAEAALSLDFRVEAGFFRRFAAGKAGASEPLHVRFITP